MQTKLFKNDDTCQVVAIPALNISPYEALQLNNMLLYHITCCCNSEAALTVPVEIKAGSTEVHQTPNKLQ